MRWHTFTAVLLPCLVLIAAVGSAEASIHIYNQDPFREVGNAFLRAGGSEGILASQAKPPPPRTSFRTAVHDGLSYIRFENITFWRNQTVADEQLEMADKTGLVQILIFEAADRDNIGGSPYGGQRSMCCTADLAKMEGCKQGEIIRTPSATNMYWPIVVNVYFKGNSVSAHLKNRQVYIRKTGMYNLFFISCDPTLKDMKITGKTLWKNPQGYLPGRMSPLMKFYVIMALCYVVLSALWFFQYYRYWKDVLSLQHCIAVVIAFGLLEMIFWYFDYSFFNNTGTRPVGITTWVVTLGAIRKTLLRLLILSVSMGFGVLRPTLGGLTPKVLLLGGTYFVASELLNVTENVGNINDVAGRARLFLVIPNSCLDAFLILWIFTSLSKTLEQLQAKRSSVKLDIYRKFSNALALAALASVVWIGYEVYFKATDPFNEKWQGAWIITAFWDILGLAMLGVVCYLWAPSQSSQRYAYAGEKDLEVDDEENEPLQKGDINLVKQDRRGSSDSGSEDGE